MWIKNLFIITTITLLFGCASSPKPVVKRPPDPLTLLNHELFTDVVTTPIEDIFSLPLTEQTKFASYHQNAMLQGVREDRIIANYLDSKLSNFTYDGATLSASQSLAKNEGNCISLAILTQAYADLINLETGFREVASIPVYKKVDNTLLVSNHFKTKLYAPEEPEEGFINAIRPGTVIDYFPQQDLYFINMATKEDLIAKYYANLATDFLLESRFDHSYSYLKKAMEYSQNDPELINLAAILHRRYNDEETAVKLFEFALSHDLISSNLLASYAYLAQNKQQHELVQKLEELLKIHAKTPFDVINLAKKAILKANYQYADRLLTNLIKEFSYLPEPYFELAKLYYKKNELEKSQQFLTQALEKAEDQKKVGVYQAKLSSLEAILPKKVKIK